MREKCNEENEVTVNKIEYSKQRKSIPQMKYLDEREQKKLKVWKNFCLKKIWMEKKCWVKKYFVSKIISGPKNSR